MVWAMGFIVGMGIAFPLLVGFLARYFVLYPLNYHSLYVPFSFFAPLSESRFTMAFCSGLVLNGLVFTLLRYPAMIWQLSKQYSGYDFLHAARNWRRLFRSSRTTTEESGKRITIYEAFMRNAEPLTIGLACILFLGYFNFSLISQVVMIGLTILFSYQIAYFSGKVGLVPFGRFTTFVMLPFLTFFRLDYLQLTILCVFTNVCFGAATDLLFDYKVGSLCGIPYHRVHRYQWLGLVVTSLSMGGILWFLFTNFTIGSPELFVHRARVRALLVQSLSFDLAPMILGFLFGFVLKRYKLNPMMVFGGILMPPSITIGLMIGACISWFDTKAKDHIPFWSGIFAGESTWVMVQVFLKVCGG